MMYRISSVVLICSVCALLGCDPSEHHSNAPDPTTLDFHTHTLVINVRTIHQSADTLGVLSMSQTYPVLHCLRDYNARLDRREASVGYLHSLGLVYADTAPHLFSTSVKHFVGYQGRYGGDTTRLSAMDQYGEWQLVLALIQVPAVLRSGDTVTVDAGNLYGLPDTIRADGTIEWDVTVDMDGLVTRDSSASEYTLQADRISVRQR
jgi:hypothetical protein